MYWENSLQIFSDNIYSNMLVLLHIIGLDED